MPPPSGCEDGSARSSAASLNVLARLYENRGGALVLMPWRSGVCAAPTGVEGGIRRVLVGPLVNDRGGHDAGRRQQEDQPHDRPALIGFGRDVTRYVCHGLKR